MNALKHKRENENVFHCNDISQKSKICGITRSQISKKSLLQLKIKEEN